MKALVLIAALTMTHGVVYAETTNSDDEVNTTSDGVDVFNESKIPSILFCTKENTPALVKPIENLDIISGKITYIDASSYFTGSDLHFSISYNQKEENNAIKFDRITGDIEIHADAKDNLIIKITANNSCGEVSSSFNIQIDEED